MRKSRQAMQSLFALQNVLSIDVIAIQEPWRNTETYTTYHPLKEHFHLDYQDHSQTRVCFFINKSTSLASWHTTHVSPDISTLSILAKGDREIRIHNIYNPCQGTGSSTLPALQGALSTHEGKEQIVLGDFNLHHPSWGGLQATIDADSEELLLTTEQFLLQQLLPPGTPTYEENCQTTIDLIYAIPTLTSGLISCTTDELFEAYSDHLPIVTRFSLQTIEERPYQRRNWKRLNLEILRRTLSDGIREKEILSLDNTAPWELTREAVDTQIAALVDCIQQAITLSTPFVNITPRSRMGFTPECKEARDRCRQLRNHWRSHRTMEAWEEYRIARNLKRNLIKKAMTAAFRQFISEACESPERVWKSTKWSRNTSSQQSRPPALTKEEGATITTPKDKAALLLNSFFPPPVQADLQDIQNQGDTYEPPYEIGAITTEEIANTIRQAPRRKAPGSDQIPNLILQQIADTLPLPRDISIGFTTLASL